MWSENATGREDDWWDEPEPEDPTEYEYCAYCGWIAEHQVHEEDCTATEVRLAGEPKETPRKGPASEPPLTPRELEIARLVGSAASNKAIAHELGISEYTVKNHLGRIFGKLGLDNRTELAIWIRRNWRAA